MSKSVTRRLVMQLLLEQGFKVKEGESLDEIEVRHSDKGAVEQAMQEFGFTPSAIFVHWWGVIVIV